MIQQNKSKLKNKNSPSQALYRGFKIKSVLFLKYLTRNSSLAHCLNRYQDCFWLDSVKHYKKLTMIWQHVIQFDIVHLIIVSVGLESVDLFSHVSFHNLKIICLQSNKIQNIQALCMVYMPNVREISLRNNYLTSIKSLRKISHRQNIKDNSLREKNKEQTKLITKLALDGNKIMEISWLFEGGFNLEGLFLDIATYDYPCGVDLRPLAKAQFKGNSLLVSNSWFRLQQPSFQKSFLRKTRK